MEFKKNNFSGSRNINAVIIIFFIFLFTITPRILSVTDGLPYLHYYDEPKIIQGAVNGLKRFTEKPKIKNLLPISSEVVYGGFLRYTCMLSDVIYFGYLKITDPNVSSFKDVKTNLGGDQPLTISHPGFYYWNRVYASILSVIGFVFLFLLGRLMFGTINGLIAVFILAALNNYFRGSFIFTTNVPMSTWIIAALYFAVKYNHTKEYRQLLFSLVFAGLAMATKMTGAASVLIPLTAGLLNYNRLKHEKPVKTLLKAMYLGLIPLGIFLLFNPSVYLNNHHFMHWMRWLSDIYRTGGAHFSREPGWDHFTYQLTQLKNNLGSIFTGFSILGLFIGFAGLKNLKKENTNPAHTDILIISLFPIIYILYVTMQYRIAYHRNFLFMYPILALLAVNGITWMINSVTRISPKIKKYSIYIFVIILLTVIYGNRLKYRNIYLTAKAINQARDTRTKAIQYIQNLSDSQSTFLGVEKGLKVSLHDLRESKIPFGYFNIENLDEATKGFTHLIVPDYEYVSGDQKAFSPEVISNIDSLITTREIKELPGSKINYFHDQAPWDPIVNPAVNILKGSDYPPPKMADFILPILQINSLKLIDHIPVLIYSGKPEPGSYILAFQVSGMEALGEYPEMEILVNDKQLAFIQNITANYSPFDIEINVYGSSAIKIYLRMTNDYWNEITLEDRNTYLKNIEFAPIANQQQNINQSLPNQ